jgi:hypothetical protein
MSINILLNKVDYCYLFYRPEFIEFFGLHVTSANGSPILTASASPLNHDNNDTAKANDDEMEIPSTPVVKFEKFFYFYLLLSSSPILIVLIWERRKKLRAY